ncbi:prenyltransferase [Sanghuangporus baumii]|uniref:Prenyltransferase n=1 Tax=Sanghuangporus baumii TaxID=108892 RepID=A0A9Q5N8D2_SANBA|nr:prenyltransferase [Sanghuangporus baumii]
MPLLSSRDEDGEKAHGRTPSEQGSHDNSGGRRMIKIFLPARIMQFVLGWSTPYVEMDSLRRKGGQSDVEKLWEQFRDLLQRRWSNLNVTVRYNLFFSPTIADDSPTHTQCGLIMGAVSTVVFSDYPLSPASFTLGIISLLSSLIAIGFGVGLIYVLVDVPGGTLQDIDEKYPRLYLFALSIPELWALLSFGSFFIGICVVIWEATNKGWIAKAGVVLTIVMLSLHLVAFGFLFHKKDAKDEKPEMGSGNPNTETGNDQQMPPLSTQRSQEESAGVSSEQHNGRRIPSRFVEKLEILPFVVIVLRNITEQASSSPNLNVFICPHRNAQGSWAVALVPPFTSSEWCLLGDPWNGFLSTFCWFAPEAGVVLTIVMLSLHLVAFGFLFHKKDAKDEKPEMGSGNPTAETGNDQQMPPLSTQTSQEESASVSLEQHNGRRIPSRFVVFGVNDVYDYASDLRNPRKQGWSLEGCVLEPIHHDFVLTAARVASALVLLSSFLNPSLSFSSFHSPSSPSVNFIQPLLTAVILILGWQYSSPPLRLKERPILDSLSNGALVWLCWALGYTSSGHTLFGPNAGEGANKGWLLALCTSGVHALGAAADVEVDNATGQRTIATAYGRRAAAFFSAML